MAEEKEIKGAKACKALNESFNTNGHLTTAMRHAGYTAESADKQYRLRGSKIWNELTETYFPDDSLVEVHRKLLEKKETFIYKHKDGRVEVIKTDQPHTDALRALDMIYKVKGHYKQVERRTSEIITMVDVYDAIGKLKRQQKNGQQDDTKLIEGAG